LTFTPDCTFESPGELLKPTDVAESQWLMPVILATQEAEIRRIVGQSQPGQIIHKTLSQKNPTTKKLGWWSGSR
jgi:hypothetical protein